MGVVQPKFQSDKPFVIYRADSSGHDGFFGIDEYLATFPKSPWHHDNHYAGGIFEGIIAVRSERDPRYANILTLDKHVARMMDSMASKLLVLRDGYNLTEARTVFQEENPELQLTEPPVPLFLDIDGKKLESRIVQTLLKNFDSGAINLGQLIYIRPRAGRGEKYDETGRVLPWLGVYGLDHEAVLEMSAINVKGYLDSLQKGGKKLPIVFIVGEPELVNPKMEKDAPHGIMTPERAIKATANYGWPGVLKGYAVNNGFAETLVLDPYGMVLEGGGENVFMIKGHEVITPPLTQSVLPGTKRGIVKQIANLDGIKFTERPFHLDELMDADAMAVSGTWTGFKPVDALYHHGKRKTKSFNAENETVARIDHVYDDIANDREVEPKFNDLQRRVLFPQRLS